jgi:branched-chain amino acid aminotransferase
MPLITKQMTVKEIYMNGKFIPFEEGVISVRNHCFSYGTGCFEGIRGYWNGETQQVFLFRLREHYERLERSCKTLLMSLPHTIDELMDISIELVKRNDQREDVYLRPVVYKDAQIIGVRLHDVADSFLLTSEPMGNYVETSGLRCGVSSWRRIDDNAIPARAKVCGAYVNSALAKTEALQNGFDEAIMLTHDGHVSEGSAENIFLLANGELVTPAPTENILLGITRDTLMEIAQQELGLPVRERSIDRTELYTADEVLLCGTGAQVAPVVEIDHRPIGNGQVGPITSKLQKLYFDIVRGKRPAYSHWYTPVHTQVAQRS